jgi:hypothetical protein
MQAGNALEPRHKTHAWGVACPAAQTRYTSEAHRQGTQATYVERIGRGWSFNWENMAEAGKAELRDTLGRKAC